MEVKVFSSDNFLNAIESTIAKRMSCRSFSKTKFTSEDRVQLQNFFKQTQNSPFSNFGSRFEIIELDNISEETRGKLGTYGFIQGAHTFLIGIMNQMDFDHEHIGYTFEKLILFVTYMGLGSCWLGGTFHRAAFTSIVALKENETIPVISPIGLPAQDPSFRSKIIRWAAQGAKRKSFSELFFQDSWKKPLQPNFSDIYSKPLEMVRLAPSASNRQPWRILYNSETQIFHFFVEKDKKITHQIIKWPDFSRIDLGIAVCHFDLTVQSLGLKGRWTFLNEFPVYENLDYLISWIPDRLVE